MVSYRVLIVEDDDLLRGALREVLERFGYQVCEAGNGVQALRRAEAEQPHLILMDLGLPDGDGLEFAQALRRHPPTMGIPIAILTGQEIRGPRAEALGTLSVGTIPKPVTLERFHRDLQLMLGPRKPLRRFPRFAVETPVLYRLLGEADAAQADFLVGVARTLSEGGLMLELPEAIAAPNQVELRLPSPSGDIHVAGKVVYSKPHQPEGAQKKFFHHGVQFLEMDRSKLSALKRLVRSATPAAA